MAWKARSGRWRFFDNSVRPLPVNEGERSVVSSIDLVFDEPVSLSGGVVSIAVNGTLGTAPTLSTPTSSDGGITWTITFSGSGVNGGTGSIAMGVYDLTVNAADVHAVAGGTAMASNQTFTFDCLPGDINGDRVVNSTDQTAFSATYLRTSSDPLFQAGFDLDGDHSINSSDFANFSGDLGSTITWTQDSRVAWTATQYDADGEITKKQSGDNGGDPLAQETYTYDGAGRLSTQTTFEGVTTTYTYDSLGQILTQDIAGVTTTFSYDDTGNRTSVVNASGTSTYTSDGTSGSFTSQDNRLASDGTWNYEYDAVGNRTEKDSVSGSGEKWEYHYDDDNELVEVDHLNDGTHVDLRVDYQYDAWGNRVATSTDTDGDGYQALSQWASSVVGYSSQNSTSTAAKALGSPDATYGSSGSGWTPNTFFGTSNLTLAYTTPVYANGVTVVESGANGFVTEVDLIDTSNNAHVIWTGTDKTPQGSVGDFTISFEATSYQVEAVKIVIHQNIGTSPQIDAVSLHASGASTTTGSNADPVTVNYVLDGWNPMTQGGVGTSNVSVRMDVNASDGSLATRYLWSDQVDQLAGRVDYSGGGTTASVKWYVLDREDSIQEILDGTGKVIDALTYDAYGNILTETDPTQRGRYAWTGRELDAETGLQYNRARWYDPGVGSWVSQDPMGFAAGDSNLYRYARNQPTDWRDPSGLDTVTIDGSGNIIWTASSGSITGQSIIIGSYATGGNVQLLPQFGGVNISYSALQSAAAGQSSYWLTGTALQSYVQGNINQLLDTHIVTAPYVPQTYNSGAIALDTVDGTSARILGWGAHFADSSWAFVQWAGTLGHINRTAASVESYRGCFQPTFGNKDAYDAGFDYALNTFERPANVATLVYGVKGLVYGGWNFFRNVGQLFQVAPAVELAGVGQTGGSVTINWAEAQALVSDLATGASGLLGIGTAFTGSPVDMHHGTPREVIQNAPAHIDPRSIQGARGQPNRTPVNRQAHQDAHAGGANGGQPRYNCEFQQRLDAISRNRPLTPQDYWDIRIRMLWEYFGL